MTSGYGHIVRPLKKGANRASLIPCVWNPRGVNAALCSDISSRPGRNEGCCREACTSPNRVCRVCMHEGGVPGTVVDFVLGVCERHKGSDSNPHHNLLSASAAALDLASSKILRQRLERKARTLKEDLRVLDPVLYEPEHYKDRIATLPKRQLMVLAYLSHGLSDEEVAERFLWRPWRVTLIMKEIYQHFSLEQIPSRSRRGVLVEIAKLWARS